MHSAIISIVLFVDAMMSLYYFVDSKHYGYWVIGIAVFYCICVFGRYFWISMKITRGWYKGCELKMNRSSSTVAIVSGVGTILIAKSLAPYVIGKDATKILFVGLMIICFSIIKYVDYFMMYYRFTKLSEEEQQYIICSGKKAQKVEKKSVYEVIGKKAKS